MTTREIGGGIPLDYLKYPDPEAAYIQARIEADLLARFPGMDSETLRKVTQNRRLINGDTGSNSFLEGVQGRVRVRSHSGSSSESDSSSDDEPQGLPSRWSNATSSSKDVQPSLQPSIPSRSDSDSSSEESDLPSGHVPQDLPSRWSDSDSFSEDEPLSLPSRSIKIMKKGVAERPIERKRTYPSNMTDAQFQEIKAILDSAKIRVNLGKYTLREVINALLFKINTGCPLKKLPPGFPPYNTIKKVSHSIAVAGILDEIIEVMKKDGTFTCAKASTRKPCLEDLNSEEWDQIETFLDPVKRFGMHEKRDAFNIWFSVRREGSTVSGLEKSESHQVKWLLKYIRKKPNAKEIFAKIDLIAARCLKPTKVDSSLSTQNPKPKVKRKISHAPKPPRENHLKVMTPEEWAQIEPYAGSVQSGKRVEEFRAMRRDTINDWFSSIRENRPLHSFSSGRRVPSWLRSMRSLPDGEEKLAKIRDIGHRCLTPTEISVDSQNRKRLKSITDDEDTSSESEASLNPRKRVTPHEADLS
jgi:transposase